jgi:hypothetical protein
MARLAEGAAGAVVEKGYGAGAAAAAAREPAVGATLDRTQTTANGGGNTNNYYSQQRQFLNSTQFPQFDAQSKLPLDAYGKAYGGSVAPDPSAAAKQASRLSSFFQRAPLGVHLAHGQVPAGANLTDNSVGGTSGKNGHDATRRPSVSFHGNAQRRSSLFSPAPGLTATRKESVHVNDDQTAVHAAALMRSPEWIAQLSMATMGAPIMHAPSPAGVAGGAAHWASPATVAPLQALYAWYSGNANGNAGKTNGHGFGNRRTSGCELRDVHASGGAAVSGLSGLSSLFDGNSPAEMEAAMHRETMHAAAAAAVQMAMGGVAAGDAVDPAVFAKAQERALALHGMAESSRRG